LLKSLGANRASSKSARAVQTRFDAGHACAEAPAKRAGGVGIGEKIKSRYGFCCIENFAR
jgi:hypothetical protein